MKFNLSPFTSLASHGDTLIFQNHDGELYDIQVEKNIHLALIQILLANGDSSDQIYDEIKEELFDIIKQLEEAGLIISKTISLNSHIQIHEDATKNKILCVGANSQLLASQLEFVQTTNSKLTDLGLTYLIIDNPLDLEEISLQLGDFYIIETAGNVVIRSPRFNSITKLTPMDWIKRRAAASYWSEQFMINLKHPINNKHSRFVPSESQKKALVEIIKNGDLSDNANFNEDIRIFKDGSIKKSWVLPCPIPRPPAKNNSDENDYLKQTNLNDINRLVSPYTGIVTQLEPLNPQPWWPKQLQIITTKIADTKSTLGWKADPTSLGTSWNSLDEAIASALGEAVERYSGNAIPSDGYEEGSYNDLIERNLPAINPEKLALFSKEQYEAKGFPFTPFTRELQTRWVWGNTLPDRRPCLVPAQLTYTNWYNSHNSSFPTNMIMFAGIAAGPSRLFAEISALEEIIERDASHIWWHGKLPASAIDFSSSKILTQFINELQANWKIQLFSIPSPTQIPVIGCLLLNQAEQLLSLGIASRLNGEKAALKAIAEAVQLHEYARGLLSEDGAVWQAVKDGAVSCASLKPYRQDRKYLDSYQKNFRDVTDLPCQMQIYLDPRAGAFVENLWKFDSTVSLNDLNQPSNNLEDYWTKLVNKVSEQSEKIVSIDITPSDIMQAGYRVIRIVAPGMYSNSPVAFPYFGGSRLKAAIESIYGTQKEWQKNLRPEPPPYA
ncbi:MAG TPA: YcaO-like family protein [Oligoflexia bacterium]|nr:YcaO-like family protein [Oligoflexia bacterium]HMP26606.1 YcaO-like family protein [Oligoflexia bacterium]